MTTRTLEIEIECGNIYCNPHNQKSCRFITHGGSFACWLFNHSLESEDGKILRLEICKKSEFWSGDFPP